MGRRSSSEEKIYRFVCDNPGNCTYEIARKLNMSGGMVRNALSRLNQKGLVRFKFQRNTSRIKKLSYPVGAMELLPRDLKQGLSQIG